MPRPAAALLFLASLLGAIAGFSLSPAPTLGNDLPPLPGPALRAPADSADPAAANAACEACHQDIAAEWRGSLHQEAWTDPVFQKAYAIEPVGFCRGCHAPEADPAEAPSASAQSVGVGCTTCHQQGRDIVGVDEVTQPGVHYVRGDARLATKQACASCHQFDFPRSKGQPMQDTLAEHASSSLSDVTCQTCHMPEVAGEDGKRHRSHDFSVISNPEMIKSAVSVTATRGNGPELAVELEGARVGHAFPTGDMFRRLELRAEAVDAEGNVVMTAKPVHLARRFGDVSGPHDEPVPTTKRVEVADTRVPPPGRGTRKAVLRFPKATRGLSVRWVVAYQRMDHAMAASFSVDQARDEIVVASGLLPPTPKPKVTP